MSSELRRAAEAVVRDYRSDNHWSLEDSITEMKAALSAPDELALDNEPVTEEWLRSVGCEDRNDDFGLCLPRTCDGFAIQVEVNGGEWESSFAEVGGDVAWIIAKIPTRCDVRLLCRVLGIKLTDPR